MLLLKKLSPDDGCEIYKMLKQIGKRENSFTNPVFDMDYKNFKEWLIEQYQWDQEINLPEGFVRQTIYWLYDGSTPVGMGKIRYHLTAESRKSGGNIGYAISKYYRGRGYGTALLKLLIGKVRENHINEIILTVDIGNIASKCVIERNGGVIFNQNSERWYFKIMEEE